MAVSNLVVEKCVAVPLWRLTEFFCHAADVYVAADM